MSNITLYPAEINPFQKFAFFFRGDQNVWTLLMSLIPDAKLKESLATDHLAAEHYF